MADKKISQLNPYSSPFNDNDLLVIVDTGGGETKKTELSEVDKRYVRYNLSATRNPSGVNSSENITEKLLYLTPTVNSPDQSYTLENLQVILDYGDTGFTQGTNGRSATILNLGFNHSGTGAVGDLNYINTYHALGNGVDPVTVKSTSLIYGFGNINANATIDGPIQGYGFQYAIDASATLTNNCYVNAFYDNMNVGPAIGSYVSFTANPTVAEIKNNCNIVALNINPTVTKLTGNAAAFGIAMNGNYGAGGVGTGGVSGISIDQFVTNAQYYNGIYVNTTNVTAGNVWAGYFNGDVNITGSLSFGGALSIGKLNAFGSQNPIVDGGGNPTSVHMMVSSMTAPASATINNMDTLGVNTAALISVGAGATLTAGPLGIGLVGLALPAVIETHTGSSTSHIGGAAFALNFSGTSTGGSVGQGYGGMFVPIPNGITTVDRWYGIWAREPFGQVATDSWGLYVEDTTKNYIEGQIKVGGSDVPASGFGLDVEDKVQVLAGDIQLGSLDPFSRTQIWNKATSSVIRLGSLGQDGDTSDASSEGQVVYGPNSQGTAINSGTGDFGYARIKADRLGLYTSIANTAFYYFRADPTEMYLKNDSNVKTFKVDRATGAIDFTPATSGDWSGDPASIQEAIDRLASAVAGLLGTPIP